MVKYFAIVLVVCTSCSRSTLIETESDSANQLTEPSPLILEDTMVYTEPQLDQKVALDEKTLFGHFFHDRVSFHIDEDPNKFVGGSEVQRIITTSIDSTVARIKYELSSDISNSLIQAYGSFRFKPLHAETQLLAKEQGVLNSATINSNLKKYQLKWELEDRTIIYQHKVDSVKSSYVCYEELPFFTESLPTTSAD